MDVIIISLSQESVVVQVVILKYNLFFKVLGGGYQVVVEW